jgi:hypothetical protein
MQWRLAIQGFFNYFANWIFTPVMFKISPAAGGQMGMSWTVLMALQAAALAWVQTRAPKFGMLAARHDYQELDRLFRRLVLVSSAALAAGCAAFLGAIALLSHFQIPLAERFLPWDSLCLFTLGIVLYHIPHCQSFYVRAHKREMFLLAGVVSSSAIGLLTVVLGARFGAVGVASGYLAVVVLFVFPYQMRLWRQCRAERDTSPRAMNEERNQGAAEAT